MAKLFLSTIGSACFDAFSISCLSYFYNIYDSAYSVYTQFNTTLNLQNEKKSTLQNQAWCIIHSVALKQWCYTSYVELWHVPPRLPTILANVNSRSRSLYVIVRPSVCSLSVCRLSSVVCNVCALYSGDWNFRQCFYATVGKKGTFQSLIKRSTPIAKLKLYEYVQ